MINQAVMSQIRGYVAGGVGAEQEYLEKLKAKGEHNTIVAWNNSMGDDSLALVVVEQDVITAVQDAIDLDCEEFVRFYLGKITDFVVFRAVTQDDGGTNIWRVTSDVFRESYFQTLESPEPV